ncbi:MAG: cytochrome ubiquinol oxidase subunit I [Micrococcales bacterium]
MLHLDVLDPLALSRWQFGLTTVYHFLFVPLTIGMVLLVAIFQTIWTRTGNEKFLKLTKLFGKIFLINFAMGVVTGIVQEFQFGMNWSDYSRFVGDIFGAPLAMEGLLAFFFEATFIGLWIFGWGRLSKGLHLMTIWVTTFGVWLSAYFILAANSFMQNPVGFEINEAKNRAELTDIGAVLTNIVALNQFPHTIMASIMFSGAVIVSVAAYHLKRNQQVKEFFTALRFGLWTTLIAGAGTVLTGDGLGLAMVQTQPMKMAAAEALYNTTKNASFSIFTWGTPDGKSELFSIRIPNLLSFLSTHTFDGQVEGLNDLQAQYVALYGPGDYMPVLWITYWAFRWMIGLGALAVLIAVVGLWITRKNKLSGVKPWAWNVAIWSAPLSVIAIAVGWTFTEMGRQPWLVFKLMKTSDGVSPGITGLDVLISLMVFTLIYGSLAVVEFRILKKAAQAGIVEEHVETDADKLTVAY